MPDITMCSADALRDLLAAVEAGKGIPTGRAADALPDSPAAVHWSKIIDAYNGSVDAAIAFVEAVLPDWGWHIKKDEGSDLCYAHLFSPDHRIGPGGVSRDDNGASALLVAALRALIAQEEA